jgi:hypothetical protein
MINWSWTATLSGLPTVMIWWVNKIETTPEQCKAARSLLSFDQDSLAKMAGLGFNLPLRIVRMKRSRS